MEAVERKCALQTEALARSEARASAAESSLRATKEDSEAAQEEDKEAIRRAAAIRQSLEAEVRVWKHADVKRRFDIRPVATEIDQKRNEKSILLDSLHDYGCYTRFIKYQPLIPYEE